MIAASIVTSTKAQLPVTKRYRIAFLCQDDPEDQRTWSGITYHLYKQIGACHDVTWVHANDLSLTQRRILSLWNRTVNAIGWKFTSQYFLNAYFLGRKISRKLALQNFDLIVIGAGECEITAYLKTKVPVIYIADTTFRNMINYYPWHTGLSKLGLWQGNTVQKKAIQKAAHLIYSSAWAADSAISHYQAKENRVTILNFGANLLHIPTKEAVAAKTVGTQCRLLLLGVQWERKGGPVVYKTFLELKRRGVSCSLTVIGCNPSLKAQEGLTIIPFLDKNEPQQAEQLFNILMDTDFLFVPTRADCTPVVFSEAAAFGIPVITTQTGGVGSVVKDGENGYCLPLEAAEVDYANLIEKIWLDKSFYNRLKFSSRTAYDSRLNWQTWMKDFNRILETMETTRKVLAG